MNRGLLTDLRQIRKAQPDPRNALSRDELLGLIGENYRRLLAVDSTADRVVANLRTLAHPGARRAAASLETLLAEGSIPA